MPWIALDDLVGIYVAALDGSHWSGAVNACAPNPATNKTFARALGRALHRPAVLPVPPVALHLIFGEMASVLTVSQRMVPSQAIAWGYEFGHPQLRGALETALS
jgi:NAD dependent epimerase/dehydratase family enzyme